MNPEDLPEPGQTIRLLHTSDPHTRLRPGVEGVVTRASALTGQISVKWPDGSGLMLLADEDDFEVVG